MNIIAMVMVRQFMHGLIKSIGDGVTKHHNNKMS